MVIYECYGRGSRMLPKHRSRLNILGVGGVTKNEYHFEDPQNVTCKHTKLSRTFPRSYLSTLKSKQR